MEPITMSPTTTEPTKPAFDFGKLRARWLREQEQQQRLSWELAARVGTVVPPVLKGYDVSRAYVFGSVAEGRAGTASDVDLLVLGAKATDYWDLRRDLEHALGRPLDLFTQDDDPVLVAKIMARGKLIYGLEQSPEFGPEPNPNLGAT
jgi:predicted nucleotidyltransferase